MSGLDILKAVHLQNPKNIILSYININSVRNKFGSICSLIPSHVDILSIAETKLDYSFPNAQFLIPNFHQPFRLDINRNSGGLLVFLRSSIPARMLPNYRLPPDIQAVPFEINLRKEKWLFVSVYKPPSLNNQYFCDSLSELLDFYSSIYYNKVVFGDFNLEISHPVMLSFMNNENFINLVKGNTCCKGKGSCIDLILTNRRYSFKHTSSTETGLSYHHHLIPSMMKTTFEKEESEVLVYRDYKNFNFNSFHNNNVTFTSFENNFVNVLNQQAPKKLKVFRGNQKPHLNKSLRAAIMKRSRLKDKANKSQLPADLSKYKKQRNLVVKLNKKHKKRKFKRCY